jgi:hypothetical protein
MTEERVHRRERARIEREARNNSGGGPETLAAHLPQRAANRKTVQLATTSRLRVVVFAVAEGRNDDALLTAYAVDVA